MNRAARRSLFARYSAALPALASDAQSVLSPGGPEAERILVLAWILFAGSLVILLAVCVLTVVALYGPSRWKAWLAADRAVKIGGIAVPVVVLSALLFYEAFTRTSLAAQSTEDPLRIAVVGEQWWWRVIYPAGENPSIETANELHIPVGRPVELTLSTADVIHSFWVPALAGKLDMIPGRTTTLNLMAAEPGLSRGQCAEYCGGAHALMSFHVIALRPDAFEAWFAREREPAEAPATAEAARGRDLFLASGCGGCHTVRGTEAAGSIGPDLTHVGSRTSLAAATLLNDPASLRRWITDNQHIKPENRMPPFGIFSEAELDALAAWLAGLR
jgi:cytochrome c oxidase subunit 2